MSDAEAAPAPEAKPKKPLPVGMILALLNTIALLGLFGILLYTQVLYKRPVITENVEREKIVREATKPGPQNDGRKTLVAFEPIQANLKPSPIGVQVPGGPPQQMKPHFLTMTISLELVDEEYESTVKGRQPKFLDQLLRELGSTTIEELSTVQGRFLLRSKMAGIMNDLVREERSLPPNSQPVISNVYFSDFMVQ